MRLTTIHQQVLRTLAARRAAILVLATGVVAAIALLPVTALASGAPHAVTLRMSSPTRLPSGARGTLTLTRSSEPPARAARGTLTLTRSSEPPARGARAASKLANLGVPIAGEQTQSLTARHRIAHTASANINSVVPSFRFFLNFNVLGPRKLQLLGFLIGPFYPTFEFFPLGGCHNCFGHGQFSSVKILNRKKCGIVPAPCLKESERGTRTLTKRSLFIQAVTSPDKIGRFIVYGVHVNPAQPAIIRQGCLGADAPLTNNDFLAYLGGANTIPRLPCNQAVTNDPLPIISPTPPFEVSSGGATPFQISGSASGSEWLAMFEVHQPCKLNSQAMAQVAPSAPRLFTRVTGQFNRLFSTAADTSPGNLCFYLQTGGGTFNGIPDGRVTMGDQVPYLAGDTVSITGPSTTSPGGQVTDTYLGNTSVQGVELWTFDTSLPCASTAQAEFSQAFGVGNFAVGPGPFSKAVSSVPLQSSAYQCAYLQLGAPSNGQPTGPTLASAAQFVTVQ